MKKNSFRIVSLIASATETVCALGLGEYLVGRSHECDYPAWVKNLPSCTKVKFAADGRSYEIHQRVKSIVQEATSVYLVNAAILDELRPTHIITQTQCEVCAVNLKDVEKAVCELVKSKPVIVSLEPNSLDDIFRDIQRVADALDAPESGTKLTASLKEKMSEIQDKAVRVENRPRVGCIEWIDPLMSAGNWMPELVEMAGGINVFGENGKHSPILQWKDFIRSNPDFILIFPCGFDIPRALADIDLLTSKPEWRTLSAIQSGNVFVMDGNQYFNRPGPRIVESLEILAEILHHQHFHFGHRQTGWIRLTCAVNTRTRGLL